jgi:hypothetical protein
VGSARWQKGAQAGRATLGSDLRLGPPPSPPTPAPTLLTHLPWHCSIILSAVAPQRLAVTPAPKSSPGAGLGLGAGAAAGAGGSPLMANASSYPDLVNMDTSGGGVGWGGNGRRGGVWQAWRVMALPAGSLDLRTCV